MGLSYALALYGFISHTILYLIFLPLHIFQRATNIWYYSVRSSGDGPFIKPLPTECPSSYESVNSMYWGQWGWPWFQLSF